MTIVSLVIGSMNDNAKLQIDWFIISDILSENQVLQMTGRHLQDLRYVHITEYNISQQNLRPAIE